MIIVPNEWIVDLLVGSVRQQRLVHEFLDKVDTGGHQLALRRQSPVVRKLQRALRGPEKRAKRLWLLWVDSNKVIPVEEHEIIALPGQLQQEVPEDDRYLVETAFTKKPCILISTDGRLLEILRNQQEFEVQSLNDFLGSMR